jgi:dTDP-4-dehydrorhamnose 3,5-epimerase/CDP-3, 6-dideoxy-D-glycero-D-glycero-4-hexulose-5-epimerase
MQIKPGPLPGVNVIELKRFDDLRGSFVKTFSGSVFEAAGIAVDMREEFYSVSAKNVLRGMHFQLPPHDHVKVVYCPVGAVLDVLLDLRAGATHGHAVSVMLDAREPKLLVIPRGIAHGFLSLTDGSLMVYKTSTEHAPTHDAGVRWDSFGFDWGVEQPVLSARDAAHPTFADFVSPF